VLFSRARGCAVILERIRGSNERDRVESNETPLLQAHYQLKDLKKNVILVSSAALRINTTHASDFKILT
jgi:hypothetical protein